MDYKFIQNQLLNWFQLTSRDLPWRKTRDPYTIWVSEIILQQTQVKQGLSYFHDFIKHFPTVEILAKAPEDEVLHVWQGLGYYSRARNMQCAAQTIINEMEGQFPTTYDELLKLKGVGPYTAAAIASFAYDLPYPCVDGNVYRVLSRLMGEDSYIDTTPGKKIFASLAQSIYNKEKPALHNQAMMEFGALQCTPSSPNCEVCPLKSCCIAYAENSVNTLPRKQGKISKIDRFLVFVYIKNKDKTYVEKRDKKGIWGGLYQFPLIETSSLLTDEELLLHPDIVKLFTHKIAHISLTQAVKHVLSHQNLYARMITIESTQLSNAVLKFKEVNINALDSLPFPVLIRKKLLKIL